MSFTSPCVTVTELFLNEETIDIGICLDYQIVLINIGQSFLKFCRFNPDETKNFVKMNTCSITNALFLENTMELVYNERIDFSNIGIEKNFAAVKLKIIFSVPSASIYARFSDFFDKLISPKQDYNQSCAAHSDLSRAKKNKTLLKIQTPFKKALKRTKLLNYQDAEKVVVNNEPLLLLSPSSKPFRPDFFLKKNRAGMFARE